MVTPLKLTPPEELAPSTDGKRVLLLEDDPDFKSILTDVLEGHDYQVVAVQNGAEGVREVMKMDFDAIVCDMMMPGLPGDMFYLAVERMRPRLCDRFVFMTGHQLQGKLGEFIARIDGVMLPKPFQVDDLLEMIGFVQVKAAYSLLN